MKSLVDECLDPVLPDVLNPMGAAVGDEFVHLTSVAPAGTDDLDIPAICQREGISVLITVNVKDFGARKVVYEALLEAGVHVVVIRPGKLKLHLPQQVALFAGAYERIRVLVDAADGPVLIRVTPGGAAESRTLEELLAEFDDSDRRRAP